MTQEYLVARDTRIVWRVLSASFKRKFTASEQMIHGMSACGLVARFGAHLEDSPLWHGRPE